MTLGNTTNIDVEAVTKSSQIIQPVWNFRYNTDTIYVVDDIKPAHRKLLVIVYHFPGLLYLWVGDHTHSFKDLHFAIRSIEDICVSTLIGDISSNSSDIAKWLSHKIDLPVLVSCNVSFDNSESLNDLNENVFKLLNKNGFVQ